jgi:DNA segregation ATPase FtsK/SpoIIIE, S-DNA-T family
MKLFWGYSYRRIISVLCCICGAFFLSISLISFSFRDPSFFYSLAGNNLPSIQNACGICGSYVAALALYIFGCSVWFIVAFLFLESFWLIGLLEKKELIRYRIAFLFLLIGVSMYSFCVHFDMYMGVVPGGLLGRYLVMLSLYCIDEDMLVYGIGAINFLGLILIVRFRWIRPIITVCKKALAQTGFEKIWDLVVAAFLSPFKRLQCFYNRSSSVSDTTLEELVKNIVAQEMTDTALAIFDDPFWQELHQQESVVAQNNENISSELTLQESKNSEMFIAPGLDLFKKPAKPMEHEEQENHARARARHLEAKLELFGVVGKVVSITTGPVVTLFEYAPAHDVKVSKILALEDDLSLALEAYSLRIIAPIPGRSVVGFEVANTIRQMVNFSDIAAGQTFKQHKGPLPLIIGRDTVGNDIVVDLTDMPHLLVAGSTGSGKSVALNAMLVSLLCRVHPDEVQLILIDPKRLEFSSFADSAHLIFPIVTDVLRVPLVLRWAVTSMEERYTRLAEVGVRHVTEYHKKYGVCAMPYIVIIIDEFADLMMTAGKEVEELIARLAQMARAAGIHLIIATQRPSVDVITGLIKVNFPSRIACKVISKVDSRTILDCAGAEKLLGKGDMLFLNQKGVLARMHGAYVRDEEITAVVDAIKRQRTATYQELVIPETASDALYEEDPLYDQVCAYVTTQDQVSISHLQRRFRIGYNRSARLIDTLEARGILMPADGSKFRKVLRS